MRDLIPIRPKSLIEVEIARDEARFIVAEIVTARSLQLARAQRQHTGKVFCLVLIRFEPI
jgi:hypothetical protein